ncbi:MAG: thioredoxin domain-containing protein [Desulfobulbaceae bacterium]|nr:thioredoxin domain-containing protein [Desulfobulbaceae bacterium]
MDRKANRLIGEKSPYLLQHAYNPVDWYPWGEEAFARARAEDKPIFLSIGYSTCHWCHVMARESFENLEIAALLNKWFVSIKVDREERPDIDQMYMSATQALNGSGGWPMSVFLFPDGKPFYAATYIPPTGMYGRPGFPEILEAVHTAWQGRRDELQQTADKLIHAIKGGDRKPTGRIEADVSRRALASLTESVDTKYGGFGSAPKFPRPVTLNFLFQSYHMDGNKHYLDMALKTLQAMAKGGIYDHLGGGFHRYSVDEQWRVPHFEKMLYDQAQLLNSYLDAFQITADKQYAAVAHEIAEYVLRDMRDPGGGFYSAEDADSEDPYAPGSHSECAYYLWTEEEIVKTLGAKAANIFNFCYGVEFNGNALNDPREEFSGRNILYLAHSAEQAAQHFSMAVDAVEDSLAQSRSILFAKREQRVRPHLDDKIITAWNGLMIGALARAGSILQEQDMIDGARAAARFIRTELYDDSTGSLQRRYRDGEAGLSGQLDDYGFLVAGLLELYQVEQNSELLTWALEMTETSIRLFWDTQAGGFFDSLADDNVPLRLKSDYDGALPAPNSIVAMNLLRLGWLTANEKWQLKARQTLDAFSSQINTYPPALFQMLCVLDRLQEKPEQLVIAGKRGKADTRVMLAVANSFFNPARIVLLADGAENQKFLGRKLPFIRTVAMQDGVATAYVCRDYTCRLPVISVEALEEQLGRKRGKDL